MSGQAQRIPFGQRGLTGALALLLRLTIMRFLISTGAANNSVINTNLTLAGMLY